ncbi:ATP-binding cassette domain-containing protein [Demequina litorisediminis]|uniref:ATP-binding cassette domain-containing protein n=1 Tax=Demequina litorisediminis TaxID=1849022 RepID=UPI0024E09ECF|nr:ATP-binding cassette domain-containing protein [Demequina litorisediminis]
MTTPAPAAGPPATLLDFADVEMTFPDGTVALRGVDLAVRRGEFVTVVGPSGCGKSTLLRIASGLETPSHGEVSLATDRIGYVFQDATLLPWRTTRRNVEAPRGACTASRRNAAPRPRRKRSTLWASAASRTTCHGSVRRHEDARLAGAQPHPRPRSLPVR